VYLLYSTGGLVSLAYDSGFQCMPRRFIYDW